MRQVLCRGFLSGVFGDEVSHEWGGIAMEKNEYLSERTSLIEMLQAADISQSIYVAAKLGIADLL